MASHRKLLPVENCTLHASVPFAGREETNLGKIQGIQMFLDPSEGLYIEAKGRKAFIPAAGLRIVHLKAAVDTE